MKTRGANAYWSLLESVANSVFLLCVISLLSRYGGLADVGRYGLAMAISAPIFMLVNMRLRFVYVAGRSECYNAFGSCFVLRVITSSCAAIIIIAVAWIASSEITSILIVVTLYKYIESLSDYIYSMFHRHAEMWIIARSSIISAFISVFAVWIMLESGFSVDAALLATVLVRLNVFILHDLRKARTSGRDWGVTAINCTWLVKAITNLAPLGILAILASFSFNAPRLFLGWDSGVEAAGVYTGLAHLALGGALVVNAIAFPWLRELGESHEQGKQDVTNNIIFKLMFSCAVLGIVLVVGVYFFGDLLLRVLYGDSFKNEWHALILILIAGTLYYQVLIIHHVGTSIGLYKHIVVWQGMSLAIILIGLYLLAPGYGVIGAGIAWALGSMVQVIMFLNAKRSMFA